LGEKLNIEAEDGSVEEIAYVVVELYDSLYKRQDMTQFEVLEKQWDLKRAKLARQQGSSTSTSISSSSNAPAPVPEPTESQEVEMSEAKDPDGWEVVSYKKKKK